MPIVTLQDIFLSYGQPPLLDHINLVIEPGERVCLIGRNGAGKSTLLKIIAGDLSPNNGTISCPNDSSLGFLRQDLEFEDGRTVKEEAEQAFIEIKALELKMSGFSHQMATRTDYESDEYMQLIIDNTECEERFSLLGGYTIQSEMGQVLIGLGFTNDDLDKQTNEFSGGWRMRLELAKLLLQKPDVLLLDEPTNHLDMKTKDILKTALKDFDGTLIVVSHDRDFLSGLCHQVVEFKEGKTKLYLDEVNTYLENKKLDSLKELEKIERKSKPSDESSRTWNRAR